MGLDRISARPHERLAAMLSDELDAMAELLEARMVSQYAPRIADVTAHLIRAGGKRLRPMLSLAVARMYGYEGENHIRLAATVEFIHTATLLHDDVVDESRQRRGRPTANLLWDNKSSVLVGDYLFARSFELMVEIGSLQVLDILSRASATIAEGEVLQLSAERNLATNAETYLRIVRGKTAALFAAACATAGLVAGRPSAETDALATYGDALGIAFQITDDLLDYRGNVEVTGKNVGDDFRDRKMTLPVILCVAHADDEERGFWKRTIEQGDQREGDVARATALMERHRALQATETEARMWSDRARAALEALPPHPLRDTLADLAGYVVDRVA
ncbi:polyprenyl synthetase family protein [Roseitranquillus sediminis]|uniref:polyprenyl synthetase family protein n=1 Tax=Roseitranquillus sediminis TaxID=2809051 RepID=UPI001D0C1E3F|nr:polyprenyl synthetase family protein [Roseitranquillus sediminis]MBM9593320.1 polyprenyl synthetase family protein [Roseitranquillus sediminis]